MPGLHLFTVAALLLCDATSPLAASSLLRSDFDANGTVDFPDFLIFIDTFNRSLSNPDYDARADLDDDGIIDFSDFLIFLGNFGDTTPDVGNDVGNGLEIIHGPDGPDGPEGPDRDNPFRSLTVHPLDANTVLLGTERNGFVKSIDGGQTWTRHRLGLRHQSGGYPEIWDISLRFFRPQNRLCRNARFARACHRSLSKFDWWCL